jgi:hypothetical protein
MWVAIKKAGSNLDAGFKLAGVHDFDKWCELVYLLEHGVTEALIEVDDDVKIYTIALSISARRGEDISITIASIVYDTEAARIRDKLERLVSENGFTLLQ